MIPESTGRRYSVFESTLQQNKMTYNEGWSIGAAFFYTESQFPLEKKRADIKKIYVL